MDDFEETSAKPTRKGRSTRATKAKKATAEINTGSQRSTRSTRSRKKDVSMEDSPVYSMVAAMKERNGGRLLGDLRQLDDLDIDKTPVARQVAIIRSPSPSTPKIRSPSTVKNTVRRKFSVKDKASAYEEMLAKRTSQSPASPRSPLSPLKGSSRTPGSASTPPTPNTVTQTTRSTALRLESDRRSESRRSSRQSLKVLASKARLSTARGRPSMGGATVVTKGDKVAESLQKAAETEVVEVGIILYKDFTLSAWM